jgi:hypothetical protein
MHQKPASFKPSLLNSLSRKAIEEQDLSYQNTNCSAEVEARLSTYQNILMHTQERVNKFKEEIATLFEQVGIGRVNINHFLRSTALAPNSAILELISQLNEAIPNSFGQKFNLGVTINEFNKCFDPYHLRKSIVNAGLLSTTEDPSWVEYIANSVSGNIKKEAMMH